MTQRTIKLADPPAYRKRTWLRRLQKPSIPNAIMFGLATLTLVLVGWRVVRLLRSCAHTACDFVRIPTLVDPSNLLAVQIGMLSILFPLVILILEREDEAASRSVVSKREILLHHAFAFPASIILPILSTSYLFVDSKHLGFVLSCISVLISLVVLFRLFECSFSLVRFRETELNLIRDEVQRISAMDAVEKKGFSESFECIQALDEIFSCNPYLSGLGRPKYARSSQRKVSAKIRSVVKSINLRRLQSVAKQFRKLHELSPKDQSVDPQHGQRPKIYVSGLLGMVVDQRDSPICTFEVPLNASSKDIQDLEKQLRRSFGFSRYLESHENVVQALVSRVLQMGIHGIDARSPEAITSASEAIELLYDSFLESLRYLGIQTTFGEAANESSPLNPAKWRLFLSLDDGIRRLERTCLFREPIDPEIVEGIFVIAYRLAISALAEDDALGFLHFVQHLPFQARLLTSQAQLQNLWLLPNSMIGNIYKYEIVGDLRGGESHLPDTERWRKFVRQTFLAMQEIARTYISIGSKSCFSESLEILDYDAEEQMQIVMSETAFGDAHQRLDISPHTLSRVSILVAFRLEVLLGLASYALQIIDGAIDRTFDKQPVIEAFRSCILSFPDSFSTILMLYLNTSTKELDDHWGWISWEEQPTGQVFHPRTSRYVERVFACLMLRTVQEVFDTASFPLEALELSMGNTFSLRNDGSLRKAVDQIYERPESRSVDVPAKEYRDRLFEIFDRIEKEEKRRAVATLIDSPISDERKRKFKNSLEAGFFGEAILRRIFGTITSQDYDANAPVLQINTLERREFFIADPPSGSDGVAEQYGRDLARGEDLSLYLELSRSAGGRCSSITEGIGQIVEAGVPLDRIVVLMSRDPDLSKFLRNHQLFRPVYRLAAEEIPNLAVNVTGVYQHGSLYVPVVVVYYRMSKDDGNDAADFIVCGLDSAKVQQRLREGVSMEPSNYLTISVVDPERDEETKRNILARSEQYSYLRGLPHEERQLSVGLCVWLRVTTQIGLSVSQPGSIRTIFCESDETDVE